MALKQGWIVVAGLVALGLQAQEAAPGGASAFEKSLSMGVNLTDGNSETMLANGSLLLSGEKDRLGSFKAGMECNYGENTTRSVVDGVEIETSIFPGSGEHVEMFKDGSEVPNKPIHFFVLHAESGEIGYMPHRLCVQRARARVSGCHCIQTS